MEIAFENPWALWFLFVIPIMFLAHFYWLRRTKRKAMKFANFRALKRITGKKLITKNYTILAMRILIIIVAILAAAQAVLWYEGEANDFAYVIAIDTSASMQAEDLPPSRLEAAKSYGVLFVDTVVGSTQMGVISFSGVTLIEQTLTDDKGLVKERIDDLELVGAGGTDIPGAIITSANLMAGIEQGKAIVLITDGSNTLETFTSDSMQEGIGYAKKQHVTVHTIGVGSESSPIGYLPTYYNISAVYNEENLEHISNVTGGNFYRAESNDQLREAYEAIAAQSDTALIRKDLWPGFILVMLLLLFIEWGLISTRFRALP